MGMFDTFHTGTTSIQTKELECTLEDFCLGDTVPDYTGNFDGPTGNYFLIKNNTSIFIINNIYVDYLIMDSPTELKLATRDVFKTYLTNPEFLANRLSYIIKDFINPVRTRIETQRCRAMTVLGEYNDYKNQKPEIKNERIKFMYHYIQRFENGESLESILNEVLTENYDEPTESTN